MLSLRSMGTRPQNERINHVADDSVKSVCRLVLYNCDYFLLFIYILEVKKMNISKIIKIGEKLSKRENWTDELLYVNYTRLMFGFILGIIWGLVLSTIL